MRRSKQFPTIYAAAAPGILAMLLALGLISCRKVKEGECSQAADEAECGPQASANGEPQPSASMPSSGGGSGTKVPVVTPKSAVAEEVPGEVPGSFSFIAATPRDGSISLSWNESLGAQSYSVTRGTTSGTYPSAVAVTTATSYDDVNLVNGTKYFYMVTASNSQGATFAAAEVSATPAPPPVPPPPRKVGGTVIGLSGSVVLEINGHDALTVSTSGAFTFPGSLIEGDAYNVTVKTQPADQICTVGSGSGTVAASDISDVALTCAIKTFTVGGNATNVSGTLVLRNNGGNDLSVNSSGSFAFSTAVAKNAAYVVTVGTQPAGLHCVVSNGTGIMGDSAVTNVSISCANLYAIGGNVSGLSSGTVVLRNNGGNDLSLTSNGSFSFSTQLASGSPYSVTVQTQPSGDFCTVSSGSGTVGGTISSVSVICGNKITLFSSSLTNGNIGGRAGADTMCSLAASSKSLSCGHVRALISVSATDEIRDMPSLYEVPTSVPIKSPLGTVFYSDWGTAFGGSNAASTLSASGILSSFYWWSGSTASGALDPFGSHCANWTSDSDMDLGVQGYNGSLSPSSWIADAEELCDASAPLLCICY